MRETTHLLYYKGFWKRREASTRIIIEGERKRERENFEKKKKNDKKVESVVVK